MKRYNRVKIAFGLYGGRKIAFIDKCCTKRDIAPVRHAATFFLHSGNDLRPNLLLTLDLDNTEGHIRLNQKINLHALSIFSDPLLT